MLEGLGSLLMPPSIREVQKAGMFTGDEKIKACSSIFAAIAVL